MREVSLSENSAVYCSCSEPGVGAQKRRGPVCAPRVVLLTRRCAVSDYCVLLLSVVQHVHWGPGIFQKHLNYPHVLCNTRLGLLVPVSGVSEPAPRLQPGPGCCFTPKRCWSFCCRCGIFLLFSLVSQELVVSSWCVLILVHEGRVAVWELSAAVRGPHSAQAPSWETWDDVGFVWAGVTPPKGLVPPEMTRVAIPRIIWPENVLFKQTCEYMILFAY